MGGRPQAWYRGIQPRRNNNKSKRQQQGAEGVDESTKVVTVQPVVYQSSLFTVVETRE